jgi:hypothetical protein
MRRDNYDARVLHKLRSSKIDVLLSFVKALAGHVSNVLVRTQSGSSYWGAAREFVSNHVIG